MKNNQTITLFAKHRPKLCIIQNPYTIHYKIVQTFAVQYNSLLAKQRLHSKNCLAQVAQHELHSRDCNQAFFSIAEHSKAWQLLA